MGAHWTCCTPEQHPELERSDLFSDEEWKKLYAEAKTLVKTNNTSFDNSIRQQLVLKVLQGAYKGEDRKFQPLPLACERRKTGNTDYVEWSSSATIFGDITSSENDLFTLLSSHQCEKLVVDEVTGKIKGALVKDLLADEHIFVQAKRYVVCAGATLTPGILFNSGFTAEEYSLPALVSGTKHILHCDSSKQRKRATTLRSQSCPSAKLCLIVIWLRQSKMTRGNWVGTKLS